ncbi:hypothetical protein O6H91_15G030600 [Diphasiastrum complanatum]|uniref:Uncharacterized protein n=2 Tax=Diphasiastrum complanatum TaxID=34168 RepID=A0ACC2BGT7_DIPCM|nr:hypothetical protein O6H91_15G027600 [Diphasiastrum complanatum]KAJ7529017.1 hypothetical protein O6H91_15G030600 [Diphasiastrum complanatum]
MASSDAACCVPAPPSDHASSATGAAGKEERWRDLGVYVVNSTNTSAAAVILISDVFGWDTPLLRKLADKVSAAGYLVVVPDVLHDDPFKPAETGSPFAAFPAWLQKHEPLKAVPEIKQIIEILKGKSITSIGVAGFCWGAKVAVLLARQKDIKAAVLLHPSRVVTDDFKEIIAPIAILAAEIDQGTPPSLVKEFRAVLTKRPEIDSFVKIYPEVAHGWTIRYDRSDKKAVQQADEAHQDMLSWFWKYLK